MRQLLAAALFALAILLISGCIGDSRPAACANIPASRLANCIYTSAVTEQNPFYCYSIQGASQRETCIKDASNPAMKKVLDRALPSERESIFGQPEDDEEKPPAPPQAGPKPKPPEPCAYSDIEQKDSCIKGMAANQSEIAACEKIQAQATRERCISEIAQKTKNVSACDSLAVEANRALCNLYSQG